MIAREQGQSAKIYIFPVRAESAWRLSAARLRRLEDEADRSESVVDCDAWYHQSEIEAEGKL